MAIDFTTFTEVDPNGHIVVTSSVQINWNGITKQEDAYVYKATDSSIGDFLAKGSFEFTARSGECCETILFSYTDEIDDWNSVTNGVALAITTCDAPPATSLRTRINSSQGNTAQTILSFNTRYWWTMERISSTVTLKIYTDSGRANQIGSTYTRSISASFDYAFAIQSYNQFPDASTNHGIIYELEEATGLDAPSNFHRSRGVGHGHKYGHDRGMVKS